MERERSVEWKLQSENGAQSWVRSEQLVSVYFAVHAPLTCSGTGPVTVRVEVIATLHFHDPRLIRDIARPVTGS